MSHPFLNPTFPQGQGANARATSMLQDANLNAAVNTFAIHQSIWTRTATNAALVKSGTSVEKLEKIIATGNKADADVARNTLYAAKTGVETVGRAAHAASPRLGNSARDLAIGSISAVMSGGLRVSLTPGDKIGKEISGSGQHSIAIGLEMASIVQNQMYDANGVKRPEFANINDTDMGVIMGMLGDAGTFRGQVAASSVFNTDEYKKAQQASAATQEEKARADAIVVDGKTTHMEFGKDFTTKLQSSVTEAAQTLNQARVMFGDLPPAQLMNEMARVSGAPIGSVGAMKQATAAMEDLSAVAKSQRVSDLEAGTAMRTSRDVVAAQLQRHHPGMAAETASSVSGMFASKAAQMGVIAFKESKGAVSIAEATASAHRALVGTMVRNIPEVVVARANAKTYNVSDASKKEMEALISNVTNAPDAVSRTKARHELDGWVKKSNGGQSTSQQTNGYKLIPKIAERMDAASKTALARDTEATTLNSTASGLTSKVFRESHMASRLGGVDAKQGASLMQHFNSTFKTEDKESIKSILRDGKGDVQGRIAAVAGKYGKEALGMDNGKYGSDMARVDAATRQKTKGESNLATELTSFEEKLSMHPGAAHMHASKGAIADAAAKAQAVAESDRRGGHKPVMPLSDQIIQGLGGAGAHNLKIQESVKAAKAIEERKPVLLDGKEGKVEDGKDAKSKPAADETDKGKALTDAAKTQGGGGAAGVEQKVVVMNTSTIIEGIGMVLAKALGA